MFRDERSKSVVWMLGWALCFTFVMLAAKKVSPHVSSAMMIFFRLFFGVLLSFPFLCREGVKKLVITRHWRVHLMRASVVVSAMGCTYYTYRHLPLTQAAAIGQTGPLFTALMALLFLKEKPSFYKWMAIGAGYSGVLLMIGAPSFRSFLGAEGESAAFIAVLANLLASLAVIIAKRLSVYESSEKILFYTTGGGALIASFWALMVWVFPSPMDIFYMALMGAGGALSQYCYLQALRYSPASFVTPFEYIRLCVMIPISVFIFDESPQLLTLLGSLIVFASIVLLIIQEKKESLRSLIRSS